MWENLIFLLMTKSKIFYGGICCFFMGILGRSLFFGLDKSLIYLNLSLWIVLFGLFYWQSFDWRWFFVGLIWSLMLILGIYRVQNFLKLEKLFDPWDYSGEARIVSLIQDKGDYQRFFIEISSGEKLVVYGSVYQEVLPGHQLLINCQVSPSLNKFSKFNFVRFLIKDRVIGICGRPNFQIIGGGRESIFYKKLLTIRKSFESKINQVFTFDEGAYLGGLLLGGDNRLSDRVAENFQITGTTHTVAVSGYNIAIISNFLLYFLIWLGLWRKQAFWISLIIIGLFVLLIGAPSSAIRAGIMGSLTLFSLAIGRPGSSIRMLILTSFFIGVYSPLTLIYDLGFQLSLLACLGIILIYTPISQRIGVEKDFLELKSIFWVTISAQLAVLGILIYNFEEVSVISLLANLIILPLIPLAMAGGFGVILISYFWMLGAQALALPVWLILNFQIQAVEFLAGFSWSKMELPNMGSWFLISYYLILTWLVYYFLYRNRLRNEK